MSFDQKFLGLTVSIIIYK